MKYVFCVFIMLLPQVAIHATSFDQELVTVEFQHADKELERINHFVSTNREDILSTEKRKNLILRVKQLDIHMKKIYELLGAAAYAIKMPEFCSEGSCAEKTQALSDSYVTQLIPKSFFLAVSPAFFVLSASKDDSKSEIEKNRQGFNWNREDLKVYAGKIEKILMTLSKKHNIEYKDS